MIHPRSTVYGARRTSVPTLPAPFDDISFKWDVSDQVVKLEYFGLAERLIECGAIEPHMADRLHEVMQGLADGKTAEELFPDALYDDDRQQSQGN